MLERGHEVFLAVGRSRADFLRTLGIGHHIIADIQEADNGASPSFSWFRQPERFLRVVQEEVALIQEVHPDRVLGVFRFTGYVAARQAGVPYDSFICGCMIPEFSGVLGFSDAEPGMVEQGLFLSYFWRLIRERVNQALVRLDQPLLDDPLELLKGERTFLWDFPEFLPIDHREDVMHLGPVEWHEWPGGERMKDLEVMGDSPLAVLSFGTADLPLFGISRIVRVLLALGFHVAVAAGGHKELVDRVTPSDRVWAFHMIPLHRLLDRASLLVCHGGQQTVFEALRREVPIAVMPFQPEQAHNGVCLEALGCGGRLIGSVVYRGRNRVYLEALDRLGDDDLARRINEIAGGSLVNACLSRISRVIHGYRGVDLLVECLEARSA
jgi:UDP:flavonoid glycosyltransferase YjiC (YdhE family)